MIMYYDCMFVISDAVLRFSEDGRLNGLVEWVVHIGCNGGGGWSGRRSAMSSFHTSGHRPGVVMGFLRGAHFWYM